METFSLYPVVLPAFRSACTGDSLRQCVVEINDVEKQLDKNWDDVELNAQRSQAGQLFKLRVCTDKYTLIEK